MKLTIAMAVALFLCGISLVARASIVHRHAAEELARKQAEAALLTPVRESERLAMNGIDLRLGSRLHHLAQRHEHVR